MKVNIVMVARGRERLTIQALDSLLKHTPEDLYNLTLIDDDSATDLKDVAFAGDLPNWTMLRVEKSRGIVGLVKNLGVYWAEKYWGRGDYLYLSDNDIFFTPHWLEILTRTHQAVVEHTTIMQAGQGEYHHINYQSPRPHLILGGSTHPYHKPNREIRLANSGHTFHGVDAVSGYSHLMEWRTWDAYGPMDAHAVGVGQSEDFKLCRQVVDGGGLVGVVDPPVVLDCGLTDTFGKPAVGQYELIERAERYRKQYPDLIGL